MANDITALFSHNSDIWATPKNIYQHYMNQNYFDPCPFNPQWDGLSIEWQEKNFVNPPYSKLRQWVHKSIEECEREERLSFSFLQELIQEHSKCFVMQMHKSISLKEDYILVAKVQHRSLQCLLY